LVDHTKPYAYLALYHGGRLDDVSGKSPRLVPPTHARSTITGVLPGLGTKGHHNTVGPHAGRRQPPQF